MLSRCASYEENGTNVEAYTYSYDEFGNRWSQAFTPGVSGNSGTTHSYTYNSKNQLTPTGCAGGSYCYDAAGNLAFDSLGVTWTHDAEGKLTAWNNGSITATYVYDALGQRMERSLSTGHTDAYASGILASTDGTSGFASSWWEGVGDAIYANSSTYFPSKDNLGSPRLQTDPTGATNSSFFVNIAFGDEGNASHMYGWNFFAGMLLDDPDGDMGHDYATPNRNYNPTEGRWMVPDPAGMAAVDPMNPQSWNRYAYVLNNPVSYTDPSGLECVWDNGSFDSEDDSDTGSVGSCNNAGGTWVELGQDGNWSNLADQWNQDLVASIQAGQVGEVDIVGQNGFTYQTVYNGSQTTETVTPDAANNGSWWSALTHSPWVLSWILPLTPVPGIAGVGPAGSIAWNPATKTLCGSIGAGASVGDNLAVGPVTGRTLNGQPASPSQVNQVFSGWSVNGGVNVPIGPVPVGPGVQGSANGSGAVYGPTVGVAGASVSSTYAVCASF